MAVSYQNPEVDPLPFRDVPAAPTGEVARGVTLTVGDDCCRVTDTSGREANCATTALAVAVDAGFGAELGAATADGEVVDVLTPVRGAGASGCALAAGA